MLTRKLVLVSSAVLALAACGGGGGSTVGSLGSKLWPGSTDTPTAPANPSAQVQSVDVADLKAQKVEELRQKLISKGYGPDLNNIDLSKSDYEIQVGSKKYTFGLSAHSTRNKVSDVAIKQMLSQTIDGTKYEASEEGKVRAYRQDYSIVAGYSRTSAELPVLGLSEDSADMEIQLVQGQHTQTLPTAGAFDYTGKAFSETETGDLSYRVDFGTRKGSGAISGIAETGKITLQEADIGNISHRNDMTGKTVSGPGISGNAVSEHKGGGEYKLGFFGPNAEEIAGAVYNNQGVVGFGGKKQ